MPDTVRTAVRAMYVGTGLSVIVAITDVSVQIWWLEHFWPGSAVLLAQVLVRDAITIGLWYRMATACAAGKRWGRTGSTILFTIYNVLSVLSLFAFGSHPAPLRGAYLLSYLSTLVFWLCGMIAVVSLWRPESRPHFVKVAKADRTAVPAEAGPPSQS